MARGRRIAVLVPGAMTYGLQVAAGIGAEIATHASWMVRLFGSRGSFLHRVGRWGANGIIAFATAPGMVDYLVKATVPVVNFSGLDAGSRLPTVRIADDAVGTMATRHFLDLNLKHFAFWTDHMGDVAARRKEGFFAALHARGVSQSCTHFMGEPGDVALQARDRGLRDWLVALPKPVGLFTWHDTAAQNISHMAHEAGLDIPNQIALLGVDDDPLMCHLTTPPLSSIRLPGYQVGVRTVQLLANLMDGRPVPADPITLAPTGVAIRGSTDMLAIDDPQVAAAICLIRQRAVKGLTIDDVLDTVPLSRRSLERRFRELFSRSPGEEIRRVRIEHAKNLLLHTNDTMPQIAYQCSFHDAAHFSRVFRQVVGMPPTGWRRLHRPPQ